MTAISCASEARPWYIANNAVNSSGTPSKGGNPEHWRAVRFRRRQRASGWFVGAAREAEGLPADSVDGSDWVRPARPGRCRWRVSRNVGVHGAVGDHSAHFSGLERCGSIWACPVCSAVIRAQRVREIALALERAHQRGHGIAFATLTLRHTADDPLSGTLDALLTAWRRVTSWTAWKKLSKRVGWIGTIRSVEVTLGVNGWHPHSHLAFIFERPLTEDERASFEAELAVIWRRAVEKVGASMPSLEHGVNVQLADGAGEQIAGYLGKVQEKVGQQRLSVAKELARGDLKAGRAGSVNPLELLDDETGSPRVRRLFLEYYEATKGRRAFGWSRGLRDYLMPDVEELTDEEVLEQAERGELLALIGPEDWDTNVRDDPERMHELLLAAEEDDGHFSERVPLGVQPVWIRRSGMDDDRPTGPEGEAGETGARAGVAGRGGS